MSADTPLPSIETEHIARDSRGNLDRSRSRPDTDSTSSDGVQTPGSSSPGTECAEQDSEHIRSRNSSATSQSRPGDDITGDMDRLRLSPGRSSSSGLALPLGNLRLSPDHHAQSQESLQAGQRRRSRRSSSRQVLLPHDVRDEERPVSAFHRPEFRQALSDAKRLMERIERDLRDSDIHSDPGTTMYRLHKEALKLAEYKSPSTRTVGFVGDSGAGKSSLLNSLLDVRGLARTSSSGTACTCVVTEYHYHNKDVLDVEVEFFSTQEVRENLEDLLAAYRLVHVREDPLDEDEMSDFQPQADLARHTFDAMFRGQQDLDDVLGWNSQEDALEKLCEWARRSLTSSEPTRHSDLSAESCSARLMELSSDSSQSDAPAAWPFIKTIKVYSNAYILSTGLVLVDLPGLRDLNMARRVITERYLLQCNEIFAVCNIIRAITDEGVQDIFKLARDAGLSNVGIVCTRAEEFHLDEVDKDWRGDEGRRIRRMKHRIEVDQAKLAQLEADVGQYQEDAEAGLLDTDEMGDYVAAMNETEHARQQRRTHEFELQRYVMELRNAAVIAGLTAAHETRTRVFCVSNKMYWDNRDVQADKARPYLQLSGIIDARRHCVSIVAECQLEAARSFIADEIPSLLSQVDLWVQSGARDSTKERRDVLKDVLDNLEQSLRSSLGSNGIGLQGVATSLKREFLAGIYTHRPCIAWTQKAKAAADDWMSWHHASFAAFCRNDGDYNTRAIGSRNWNQELIDPLVSDVSGPWDEIIRSIELMQSARVAAVDSEILAIIQRLEKAISAASDRALVARLSQSLLAQGNLLSSALEQHFGKQLRVSALTSISSSMIRTSMNPAYRMSKQESGSGSDGRRKTIIWTAVSDQALFESMMRGMKEQFLGLVSTVQQEITASVDEYFASVSDDMDLVRRESVARESEENPGFRNLVAESLRSSWGELEQIQQAAL